MRECSSWKKSCLSVLNRFVNGSHGNGRNMRCWKEPYRMTFHFFDLRSRNETRDPWVAMEAGRSHHHRNLTTNQCSLCRFPQLLIYIQRVSGQLYIPTKIRLITPYITNHSGIVLHAPTAPRTRQSITMVTGVLKCLSCDLSGVSWPLLLC